MVKKCKKKTLKKPVVIGLNNKIFTLYYESTVMKMQIGFYNEENTYQCSDRYQSTENVNTFIAGLSIFYIDKK